MRKDVTAASLERWTGYTVCLALIAGCGAGSGSGAGSGGGGGNQQPTTVTFTIDGPAPTAVAARIGSAPYERQTLTSGTLTLSLPAGTTDFAVAFVCPPWPETVSGVQIGQLTEQTVVQETLSDGTSFTQACLTQPSSVPTGTFTGSVDASALSGVSYLSIQAANATTMLGTKLSSLRSDFSFSAPAGGDRVEVLAYAQNPQGSLPPTSSLVAAKTFDSQPVPGALNGGNTVVLGAADQVMQQPITYQNAPSGYGAPTTKVWFYMGGPPGAFLVADGATSTYPALPVASLRGKDAYQFFATASQGSVLGLPIGPAVSVDATSETGGPMTFSFPAPWTYNGPTPAALPSFDLSYSGFSGNTYLQRIAGLGWTTLSGGTDANLFTVISSGGYRGGSATVVIPDLSGVGGFLPAPPPGTAVSWIADVHQYDVSTKTGRSVQSSGEFTVP